MRLLTTFVIFFMVGAILAQEEEEEADLTESREEENRVENPCRDKRCGTGKECEINKRGRAICACARVCPEEEDDRAKVCSNQNVTYASECELYRQKCLCHRKGEECLDWRNKHAHLDYFGECQLIAECKKHELEEYPRRMREWLYNVMEELASRRNLKKREMRLARKARQHPKKWVIPVIWKFCDLDRTKDKMISADELLPISAPLKALEHCTATFLKVCDDDESGDIDLQEWGTCMGLEKDDIEDLCRSPDGDEEED